MNMLKETWKQIRELYFGMTPGTRIVAGLLLAALLISFAYLVVPGRGASITPKETFLFGDYNFSQSQQRVVIEALGNAGLNDYVWEGYRLKVPVKQKEKYIAALSKGKAIPQDAAATILDAITASSPLITSPERRDRNRAATSLATSNALRSLGGLDDALVFTDEQYVRDERFQTERVRTATVLVRPQPNHPLDTKLLGGIAGVVKGAFGIKDVQNIIITDQNSGRTWRASDDWFKGTNGGVYLENKREAEEYFENQIRSQFSEIDGLQVIATAALDKYKSRDELTVQHGKPTVGVSDDHTIKSSGENASNAGRPGYEAQKENVPLPLNHSGAWLNGRYSYNEERARAANVMSGTEAKISYEKLTPRGMAVSLRVPFSYFAATWKKAQSLTGEQNSEPKSDDMETWIPTEIIRMKQQILPHLRMQNEHVADDAELEKLVTIEPYHMRDYIPAEPASFMENAFYWLSGNWKFLGMFGLIAVSLGVLWSVNRPMKPEPVILYEAPEIPYAEQDAELSEEESEEAGFNRTLEPFNKSMRSLQEEVSDLVNENPDAAANVLRQWIGKVVAQEH
ncbi:MAG: hypothetical protein LBT05_00465 [Planctomycetaceae bacterium]|jgi:flagellar M-ring protein FliF|nr:hypothetical protein [Planctomycetaceae bacterium]